MPKSDACESESERVSDREKIKQSFTSERITQKISPLRVSESNVSASDS